MKRQTLDKRLKKSILVTFNSVLITTPFIFTWVNEELFEFNKMLFVYAAVVIITAFWAARIIISKKLIFKKSWLDLPLLGFLLSQVLATVFSLHPRTSIFGYYTRFHGGLLSTLAYALLYWAAVSNLKREHIRPLLISSLTAAGLVSLLAIFEHFGHSFSCLLIQGKFDASCWVQDVQNRVFATFGQPNWLAAYLIMLLPVSLVVWTQSFSKKFRLLSKKSWLTVIAGLMYTALLFTKSRSGFVGFVLSLLALFFLEFAVAAKLQWWPPAKFTTDCQQGIKTVLQMMRKSSLIRKKIIAVSLLIGVLSLIFGTPYSPSLKQLSEKVVDNFSQQPAATTPTASPAKTEPGSAEPSFAGSESSDIRKIVWRGAFKVWRRYPLFGSGLETFAYSYYLDRPTEHNLVSEWDFLYNKAHNEFINFIATTGLVGFTAYFWLMLAMILSGIRAITKLGFLKFNSSLNKKDQQLIIAFISGLVAMNISNFFGFSTVMISVLMVLFAAFINIIGSQPENNKSKISFDKPKSASPTALSIITLVLVGVISLHLLFSLYKIWLADYNYTQAKSLIASEEYSQGLEKLQIATALAPKEALFFDEMSDAYAEVASQLSALEEASAAAQFAQLAVAASDKTLALNPHHLNFYKTRARVFTQLSLIDPEYLKQAELALVQAQKIAPTNPKIIYQLGLISLTQNETQEAIEYFQKAITMKPNYHQARYKLAQIYEDNKQYSQAKEQYQALLELIPNDPNLKQKLQKMEELITKDEAGFE